MTEALTPREEDDALAGEYVLGVLSHEARLAAAERLARDPSFAARVAEWEARLAPLNEGFAEAPAPDLLPAIEARLFPVPPRRRFSPLRWLAGAAVAGALVAAVLTVAFPPAPGLVVALATPDGALRYEAAFRGEALTVTRVAGQPAPAGQVHELWLLAPGASPVSLGLLRDAPLRLAYPVPPAGWMLAVSVEAEGGSPSGLPTGPVILTAPIEG